MVRKRHCDITQKGKQDDPGNYRVIILLRTLGKQRF